MNGAEKPTLSGLCTLARQLRPEHCTFGSTRGISMARFGLRSSVDSMPKIHLVRALSIGLLCALAAPQFAVAQLGGGGNTIGGGATSGVAVDADGVLRRVMKDDPTGELSRQRVQEALTRLDRNVAQRSPLRKVSLTRLERIIKQRLADGKPINDAMKHLAGLSRVQYVFCYP